jgi:cytochrome c heme-lyase
VRVPMPCGHACDLSLLAVRGCWQANSMPTQANQQPAFGQRTLLSTHRMESTIPGPSEGNWQYPSQQMFFNAMRRKGYEPKEEDMRAVVAIHNTVNEKAWGQILHWESLHPECLETLRLVRFRQNEAPSPKAQALELVGYKPPFDRHDWVVDRCGTEVRYLIDFYRGRPVKGLPASMTPMYLDARPAGDDASGAWDRVRMPFVEAWRSVRALAGAPQETKPGPAGK